MKKVAISLLASLLYSVSASADTVHVTTVVDFLTPSHSSSSTVKYAFTPSAPISFKVAGKTCNWVSSSSPYGSGSGAGAGCNYSITLDSSGNLINATSNGNGCTASGSAMTNACK